MGDVNLASKAMDVRFAAFTEVGGRPDNQDCFGSKSFGNGSCYVVSDGAGGYDGGSIASRIVVDSVLNAIPDGSPFGAELLVRGFDAAELAITQKRREVPALAQMSATVAALLIDASGEYAVWGHLGDTRIIHFRRGALDMVTRDHSVVQRLVEAGYVSAEDAVGHPNRNLLYAALGEEGDTTPTIQMQPTPLNDGDAFLICTDGLWGVLDSGAMEDELMRADDVRGWVETMRVLAGRAVRPESDNYTAIGIWIGTPAMVTLIRPMPHGVSGG